MQTLITQKVLREYDTLEQRSQELVRERAALMVTPAFVKIAKEEQENAARRQEIEAELAKAAVKAQELGVEVVEEGKSKKPNLVPVTEPGLFEARVAFGTAASTSWKSVVEVIESKNCTYMNGGPNPVQLNSVLSSIVKGKTSITENTRVKVVLKPEAK
jgi:hypothetical protein